MSTARRAAEEACHRCNASSLEPARNDQVEVREVHVDVEREAMPGDPALHGDTDGGDLVVADPDARQLRDGPGGVIERTVNS